MSNKELNMLIKVIYLTLKNFLLIVYLHDGKVNLDRCHLNQFRIENEPQKLRTQLRVS